MLPGKEGEYVTILSINKVGRIVQVLASNRFKVEVGAFTIFCDGSDLAPARPPKETLPASTPKMQPAQLSYRGQSVPEVIDLHGMTVSDAISKLGTWLDKVILSDLDRVTIIHGHGTGRVQEAVHRYLRSIPSVKRFQRNEWNLGETIVYL